MLSNMYYEINLAGFWSAYILMATALAGEPSADFVFKGITANINRLQSIESKLVRFSMISIFFFINILCTENNAESIESIDIASIPIPFSLNLVSHVADSSDKYGKLL
jgi:hypothetical protein